MPYVYPNKHKKQLFLVNISVIHMDASVPTQYKDIFPKNHDNSFIIYTYL